MIVVVTGTATDIGKTWYTAAVVGALRAHGATVAAYKPAQSFAPDDATTDADVLAAATGQASQDVCPSHRWYPVALAPPMAADVLGRPSFTIAELAAECPPAPDGTILLVEGAGGPRSPIASDGDTVDLARALGADPVVLVAHAGLGTINDVRLCAAALQPHRVIVALNRYDDTNDLHRRNRDWLRTREALEVVTTPAELATLLTRPASPRSASRH